MNNIRPYPPSYTRRHSRIHERILLSFFFQFVVGASLVIFLSTYFKWGFFFWKTIDLNSKNTLIGIIVAFFGITYTLRRLLRYPGAQSVAYVLPTVAIGYGLLIPYFLVERLAYSSQVMLIGFSVTLFWCYVGYFIGNRYRLVRYALVPLGEAKELKETHGVLFLRLSKPDLTNERVNAVIADLRSPELSAEWEKFLAHCTLSRIPVFHIKQVKESLTGRVKINHLSENEFGSLLPSRFYEKVKRLIDIFAVLFLFPFLIPFLVFVGILIKLESKGPVFFLQKRMGFRGRSFTMFKFRSMYTDRKGKGFTEGGGDPRITKVGKVIRKYRIDELPQVFNILIGQMSFIGPRPESLELSEWYEKEVPFFSYRHVVRPGISGWAQVEQGYAAEVEGMNVKLEYDFYYIKHFSFWLDTLITFKTIKTILTGFGAR
ncbi:MAG: exopolysaccharide biosynthesis polyprenyl glycosylphosphotransferase [Leptospiraceae bacterium]|nr:exopolysaccharide biosynthesis polyprenyl glycosylphosphotransferase [Leptospiraceae bacterium]MCP5503328.1 exopolysaccharide biosynthesis polyprenyl glycosylphosphotransferase [Leptospiraceae bacterium]